MRSSRVIDDILMHDQTLFKDMEAFNPDYIPENFRYRDSQMESLAVCLRPAMHGGRPVNAVLIGTCATGKTTAAKKIFQMVKKNSRKVICVYVNCQLHNTRYNIFSQIYNEIFKHYPPDTGAPFSRIYQRIMNHLLNENKTLVVALDDVNYLFQSKKANKIFYDLLRAYEIFPGVRTGVFAILSDIEFRFALDKNVNSVFIPQEIVFNPYTRDEIRNILKERVVVGFYPDVLSDDLLEDITDCTFSKRDLRVGIDLLKTSGNFAEAEASKIIKKKHIKEALKNTDSITLSYTLKTLSENEKVLLEILVTHSNDKLISGHLYKLFNEKTGSSYASFNRNLNNLEFLRVLDTKYTGKGSKGKSRTIILRFHPEEIKKCMNSI